MQPPDAAKDGSSSPMLQDVWRQPDVLQALAQRTDEITEFASSNLIPEPLRCCLAFGSGDGWFAARIASAASKTMCAASGLDALAIQSPLLEPKDRGLAISMSGNVDRTVEAARALIARGVGVSVLTNSSGGRLAALGRPVLRLELEDLAPFLCGTSSFTATLAALRICTAVMDESHDLQKRQLIETARILRDELAKAHSLAKTAAKAMGPSLGGVRILSAGAEGLGVVDYGAAKLVELCQVPAWTDDIEEFAHRQFWSAHTDELIVYYVTMPVVAEVAARSSEALASMGLRTLAIGPAAMVDGPYHWQLAIADDGADATVLAAAMLQLLAYHVSIATGCDPNRRTHLKDDTERFRVSRLLTRRTLVGSGL